MIRTLSFVALLSASMLGGAAPARAQSAEDLARQVAEMQAQLQTLQAQLTEVQARQAAAAVPRESAEEEQAPEIRFSGAPRITAPGGWSFKPRGRLQFDAAWVETPEGLANSGLGFSNEIRRARIGAEGDMPGGFGYVFEIDAAAGEVEIADALLSYEASDNLELIVGHHNNFQSLEELTSSRFTSFMERAAFTDAFNFERRLGVSAGFSSGDLRANVGLFTDNAGDLGDDVNNSMSVDGRIVYAPRLGDTQLHLGGSAHWRDNRDLATFANTRYRQRPLLHSTDVRFLATPGLPVAQETSYGLEAAVIRGPFHAAGEAHWLSADTLTGVEPTFFGGYAEIGYFLTGETRGYRSGKFDRTRVLRPVTEGGLGALQLNLRYDHLDLRAGSVNGGIQNGYQASLVWIPHDYVRFLLNYAHLVYDDSAVAAAGGDRDFSVDVIGARAQIDF